MSSVSWASVDSFAPLSSIASHLKMSSFHFESPYIKWLTATLSEWFVWDKLMLSKYPIISSCPKPASITALRMLLFKALSEENTFVPSQSENRIPFSFALFKVAAGLFMVSLRTEDIFSVKLNGSGLTPKPFLFNSSIAA